MRIPMDLDAIEIARWSRGTRLAGRLHCHPDAGSQFTSIQILAWHDDQRTTEHDNVTEGDLAPESGTVVGRIDSTLRTAGGRSRHFETVRVEMLDDRSEWSIRLKV